MFDIRRLTAKKKTLERLILEALFADGLVGRDGVIQPNNPIVRSFGA